MKDISCPMGRGQARNSSYGTASINRSEDLNAFVLSIIITVR